MRRTPVLVAADGGGTHCRLAAFADSGERLAETQAGPASLSLGVARSWQSLQQGMQQLAHALALPPHWQPPRLCLGLAGALQTPRREELAALIPDSLDYTLITDGEAQLLGATAGAPGICLALGTGSVLHWLDENGQFGMVGGWGFPLGDEASGAWLGMALIREYLWWRDRQQARASCGLYRELETHIGWQISDIQLWTTCKQSTRLATLAPLVVRHAAAGEPVALKILQQGVQHCCDWLAMAPADLPVVLVGGLADSYWPYLAARLGERLHAARGDALDGLWRYAQRG